VLYLKELYIFNWEQIKKRGLSMEEKRKYKRYNTQLSVRLTLEDATHAKAVAQSQNLSHEGMKFTTNIHVPIKSLLKLEIGSTKTEQKVCAQARVIWEQKVESSAHDIEYGVHFLSIDPIEKLHLLEKTFKDEMNK
jgi:c-di-GMP-binding flagellar brake protein YcgR